MSRLLKVLCFALAVVAMGAFAASCGSSKAQYRVVNAIPNTTTFDAQGFAVYMNGTGVLTNFAFKSTSSSGGKYLSVSGGSDTLDVYPQSQAGQTGATAVINSALNLHGGTQYTVILAGNSTASGATYPLVAQVITDNNPTPTSGDAGLRIIDTSLVLGAVDIYAVPTGTACCPSATKIASGLVYPGNINSDYLNLGIPTNPSVTIWVTFANTTSIISTTNNVLSGINAGQNYTFVLVDNTGGGSPQQFVFLTP
jgi:Domain of unknown function (DUF4397)